MRRLSLVALLAVTACGEGRSLIDNARYDAAALSASLDDPTSTAGYVIGVFNLRPNAVVDGDTIKVEALDASLRLLAIDTEETFKHEDELRAFESMEWPEYLESMRGSSGKPPKGPTPLGMDAKKFAAEFFEDVYRVRLERDHPKEIRGRYNRHLAYVFAEKDGEWVNYNLECVRAGMSPYFTKYGYSRRFHDQFSRAQEEAREKQLGIWEPGKQHYDDYDVRLAWWNSRGEFVQQFEEQAEGAADHIVLTNWDAMERLGEMRGEWVRVLATVGEVKPRKGRAPARIMLSRRLFEDFPVIAFDDEVVEDSGVEKSLGEYVIVEGRVSRYTYKARSRRKGAQTQLQIELKNPEQVQRSPGWSAIADGPQDQSAPEPVPTETATETQPEIEPEEPDPVAVPDAPPAAPPSTDAPPMNPDSPHGDVPPPPPPPPPT